MQTDEIVVIPEINGTKKQKERAELAYRIFRRHGAFYPDTAPIRITLDELSTFIRESEGGTKDITNALVAALDANPEIFFREEADDTVIYGTTRIGSSTYGNGTTAADTHSLKARFTTPEPPRPRPVSRHDEIADADSALDETSQEAPTLYPADSWQAAVAAALADADNAETGTISLSGEAVESSGLDFEELQSPPEEEMIEETVVEIETASDTELGETQEDVVLEEVFIEDVAVVDEEFLDISAASVDEITASVLHTLDSEQDAVRWGDHWMDESNIPRLSRGDLRKVQEYLESSDKPLTDAELVSDLRGIHANDEAFETERFGLNYRLSQETRDFEFVGTATQGLWALTGQLEPIKQPDRKIGDIGHDYRYLLDYQIPDEDLEEGIIEHILSYYEYKNGVLPLDANLATLMPRAAYSEQRATRLTFQNPIDEETFEAELRFPSGNRGGFIFGLADFFEDNLVPGAVITLESTDVETHFVIEYFQVSGQDRKLLNLDPKKDEYVFVATTFYCAVQDEMLLDDGHFSKLGGISPVEERVRRRPELVIARAFELIGEEREEDGTRMFNASLFDLLAVANIDRPISLEFLRDTLTGDAFPEFRRDEQEEDRFIYIPE